MSTPRMTDSGSQASSQNTALEMTREFERDKDGEQGDSPVDRVCPPSVVSGESQK